MCYCIWLFDVLLYLAVWCVIVSGSHDFTFKALVKHCYLKQQVLRFFLPERLIYEAFVNVTKLIIL